MTVFLGLMIPFLGTTLGAACVFFLKKELGANVQKALLGFASVCVGHSVSWFVSDSVFQVLSGLWRPIDRHGFPAFHGPRDPSPSHGRGEGGRPQLFIEKEYDAGAGSDPS